MTTVDRRWMGHTSRRRRLVRLAAPLRRWRARRDGYFWVRCPLCGDPFSGSECAVMLAVPTDDLGVSQMACRLCEDEWSKTAGDLCAVYGHDPVGVWKGRQIERHRTHGRARFRYRLTVGGEPDEWRCRRCHARLPGNITGRAAGPPPG